MANKVPGPGPSGPGPFRVEFKNLFGPLDKKGDAKGDAELHLREPPIGPQNYMPLANSLLPGKYKVVMKTAGGKLSAPVDFEMKAPKVKRPVGRFDVITGPWHGVMTLTEDGKNCFVNYGYYHDHYSLEPLVEVRWEEAGGILHVHRKFETWSNQHWTMKFKEDGSFHGHFPENGGGALDGKPRTEKDDAPKPDGVYDIFCTNNQWHGLLEVKSGGGSSLTATIDFGPFHKGYALEHLQNVHWDEKNQTLTFLRPSCNQRYWLTFRPDNSFNGIFSYANGWYDAHGRKGKQEEYPVEIEVWAKGDKGMGHCPDMQIFAGPEGAKVGEYMLTPAECRDTDHPTHMWALHAAVPHECWHPWHFGVIPYRKHVFHAKAKEGVPLKLAIAFVDDAWGGPGGPDCNLYIGKVRVNGELWWDDEKANYGGGLYHTCPPEAIPGLFKGQKTSIANYAQFHGMFWNGAIFWERRALKKGQRDDPVTPPASPEQVPVSISVWAKGDCGNGILPRMQVWANGQMIGDGVVPNCRDTDGYRLPGYPNHQQFMKWNYPEPPYQEFKYQTTNLSTLPLKLAIAFVDDAWSGQGNAGDGGWDVNLYIGAVLVNGELWWSEEKQQYGATYYGFAGAQTATLFQGGGARPGTCSYAGNGMLWNGALFFDRPVKKPGEAHDTVTPPPKRLPLGVVGFSETPGPGEYWVDGREQHFLALAANATRFRMVLLVARPQYTSAWVAANAENLRSPDVIETFDQPGRGAARFVISALCPRQKLMAKVRPGERLRAIAIAWGDGTGPKASEPLDFMLRAPMLQVIIRVSVRLNTGLILDAGNEVAVVPAVSTYRINGNTLVDEAGAVHWRSQHPDFLGAFITSMAPQ
jgi:hypothetical protein